jgi:hypothetical protein
MEGEGRASRHALEFHLQSDAFTRLDEPSCVDGMKPAIWTSGCSISTSRMHKQLQRLSSNPSSRAGDSKMRCAPGSTASTGVKKPPRALANALPSGEAHCCRALCSLATSERLEVLSEEAHSRRAVARMERLTQDCLLRLIELHEQLICARSVFLDAPGTTIFYAQTFPTLAGFPGRCMELVLRMPMVHAHEVISRGSTHQRSTLSGVLTLGRNR